MEKMEWSLAKFAVIGIRTCIEFAFHLQICISLDTILHPCCQHLSIT